MNRLLALRKFLGLTQRQMAEMLCIRQNAYSMIETGKTSLSARNRSILAEKLHVNPAWLTEGKGEMFRILDTYHPGVHTSLHTGLLTGGVPARQRPARGIPFYSGHPLEVPSTAGTHAENACPAALFRDTAPDYTVDFPPFNDCTFYRSVRGNSMSPLYGPGEIIACKEIPADGYLPSGEAYLCLIRQQQDCCEILRLVYPDPSGRLLLKPLNPDFEQSVVPRESLLALYIVKGKIVVNL